MNVYVGYFIRGVLVMLTILTVKCYMRRVYMQEVYMIRYYQGEVK